MSTNMSSEKDKDKMPDITLSAFKFTHEPVPQDRTSSKKTGEDKHSSTDSATLGHHFRSDFRRPEAYERIATDKPEQELAHDAAVWKLYLEEAEEHDEELVKGRHGSLDMLLLFAALFSAILTAFLIESKDLLQPDAGDTSNTLLLFIAQSQYRAEHGMRPPDNDQFPVLPEFQPTSLSRWINGIWFTSLALSLSAALLAMLGKEWLTAFLASRPRPAHTHALLRQSRLEGLEKWWALHIIALLPSLLHASLLLFAVGLVMYLWTLDHAIAAVIAGIVGVTAIFYVVTAMLGAIYEYCPFVTQVSGYVRMAIVGLFGHRRTGGNPISRYPTLQDLQALLWLTNNARDPAVTDCSYQALAGLHRPPEDMYGVGQMIRSNSDPVGDLIPIIPLQLDPDTTLTSLLSVMIDRYERLTAGSLHLTSGPEMSVARYLNAVLALAAHIRYLPRGEIRAYNLDAGEKGALALSNESLVPANIDTGLPISPFKLLTMTESLWGNDSPRFSADTYASLLVSGLEIMQLIVSTQFGNRPQLRTHYRNTTERSSIKPHSTVTKNAHLIGAPPPNIKSHSSSRLNDLRAYYSRWLIRVSTMICLHANSKITIGTRQLDKLVHSLTIAAGIDILNPPEPTSTHHPQSEASGQRTYRFIVPFGKGSEYAIRSDDLRMGPLGSLVDLLRKRPGLKDESLISTQRAALVAYAALAPILMQQVLGSSREELKIAFDMDSWPSAPKSEISGIRYIAMRQTLITARYLAYSRMANPRHVKFAVDVFKLMDVCLDEDDTSSFKSGSYLALARHSDDIIPMLEFAGESDTNLKLLPQGLMFDLMNIAQLWVTSQHISPLENALTPSCYPPLIRMIKYAKFPSKGVADMLQAMVRRMRSGDSSNRDTDIPWDQTPPIQFLSCFTHEPLVFAPLAQAGSQRKYAKPIVVGITQIVHLAANRDPALTVDPVELRPPAVRGFLDAVSLVAKYCSGVSDKNKLLMEFFGDAFTLLKIASEDDTSRKMLVDHTASQDMWDALNRVKGDSTASEMATMLRSAGERLGMVFKDPKSGKGKSGIKSSSAKKVQIKKQADKKKDSSSEDVTSSDESTSDEDSDSEAERESKDESASDEDDSGSDDGSGSDSDSS